MSVEHPFISDEPNTRTTACDVLRDSAEDFGRHVEFLETDLLLREKDWHFVVDFHEGVLRSVDWVEPYLELLPRRLIVGICYLGAAAQSWLK